MTEKSYINIVVWFIAAAMPFFLGFTTISLIVSEFYPRYAYSKSSFPRDPYGFTQEERLDLALVAVDYLRQPEPAEDVIYMLEEQRLPGSERPLYNPREIGHMIDVKHLTDAIWRLNWITAVIVLGGLVLLFARPETRPYGFKALLYGGIATVATLIGIAAFILIGWDTFFVLFHELLFPPGTWSFSYSDSLIRLFPEKFWFDLGIILSLGTLLQGVVVAAIGYTLRQRFA